eukprot:15144639-Alexandrium_andersonii.AAC.1
MHGWAFWRALAAFDLAAAAGPPPAWRADGICQEGTSAATPQARPPSSSATSTCSLGRSGRATRHD